MTDSGVNVIDTTLQKTHIWLRDLMEEMGVTEGDVQDAVGVLPGEIEPLWPQAA